MRRLLLLLALAALGTTCGGGADIPRAVCRQCQGESLTAEECTRFGETAGCATAKLLTNTDDGCAVGGEPRTYTACEFSDCNAVPDCRK